MDEKSTNATVRSEEFDRDHDGEFLVVDATTGDYAVDEDDDKA